MRADLMDRPGAAGDVTPGILVALDVLMMPDPGEPRPAEDVETALDRLAWIGRPVVLVGAEVAGRRLVDAPAERIAWVRSALARPDLTVAPFEDAPGDRRGPEAERASVEAWRAARDAWNASWLLADRRLPCACARRAGLSVVRIGPRPPADAIDVERADCEARDLLDAVRHLLARDAFAALATR